MTFACKKCKKCFRKDAKDFEERWIHHGYIELIRQILILLAAMSTVRTAITILFWKQKHRNRHCRWKVRIYG